MVAGIGEQNGRGYLLVDASGRYSADGWARQALNLFDSYKADKIIAEANLPTGQVVMDAFNAVRPNAPVKLIRARSGKRVRAEPVSLLAEQGRISHIGHLAALDTQLLEWDAQTSIESPDRLGAYTLCVHRADDRATGAK